MTAVGSLGSTFWGVLSPFPSSLETWLVCVNRARKVQVTVFNL